MKFIYLFLIPLMVYFPVSYAATFCVTTSTQLQSALDDAETNNQDNVIKIAKGSYVTLGAPFSYNQMITNADGNLEISGAWSDLMGDPCGQQLAVTPFDTVLDGNSSTRVMEIIPSNSADVTISHLFFINGLTSSSPGGGLYVSAAQNNTGTFLLQQSAFINNEAGYASAVHISGFDTMRIKNNLFVANKNVVAGIGACVYLFQVNAYGIYFINNTVLANHQVLSSTSGGGVLIGAYDSSSSMVANNLFWDNDDRDLSLIGNGQHHLINNDIGVRGGTEPFVDSDNFSAAPKLSVGGSFDYSPSINSHLVNAGYQPPAVPPTPLPFNHDWSHGPLDIFGNIRAQYGRVDIGAYESPHELPIFRHGFE